MSPAFYFASIPDELTRNSYKLRTWWITNQENAMHKCGGRVSSCSPLQWSTGQIKSNARRRHGNTHQRQGWRSHIYSTFIEHLHCGGSRIKYKEIYRRAVCAYTINTHSFRKFQIFPFWDNAITLNFILPPAIIKFIAKKNFSPAIMISNSQCSCFHGRCNSILSIKVWCYQTFMASGGKMQLLAVLILSDNWLLICPFYI